MKAGDRLLPLFENLRTRIAARCRRIHGVVVSGSHGAVSGAIERTLARAHGIQSPGRMRRIIAPAFVVFGVALLGYVGAQYGQMYLQQRALVREWQRQQHALSQPTSAPARLVEQDSPSADDGLTRLSVPKIDLDSVVVEGTSRRALLVGPGHMPDTPAPGDTGNSVITGHRDTFFRHIHELDKGDTVLVRREGKVFTYEVIGKKIVEPDDLSVIRPAKDHRLTLITCYPTYYIGPAPKRLVVFSRLVEQAVAGKGGGK